MELTAKPGVMPSENDAGASVRAPSEIAWWILAALAIGLVELIRLRLLAMPLERDEGEYAYAGQLLLQGIAPYRLAYNMKFPGAYAAYAAIMAVFGQTPTGIHLGLLLINFVTSAVVFFVGRRLQNNIAGLAAAAIFAVASLSPSLLGLALHVEHLLLVAVLSATWLLLCRRGGLGYFRIFIAGGLFGIGILMKQPAIFLAVFGGAYLVYRTIRADRGWRMVATRSMTYVAGVAVPVGLTFLVLAAVGVFPKFWFWTIEYAGAYGSIVPLREGILIGWDRSRSALRPLWPFPSLALVGLVAARACRMVRSHLVFFVLFLAASVAAVSCGFWFREHYYLTLLPVGSLLAAGLLAAFADRSRPLHVLAFFILAAALVYPIVIYEKVFRASPDGASAQIYRGNPFREAVGIGDYLRLHTEPADTVAVIGSEPEIYFYAQRHSATGYIYGYALMEEQRFAPAMQRELRREVEGARPKFIVYVALNTSWFVGPWSDVALFEWVAEYTAREYHAVGLVNVAPNGATEYCLPCDAPPAAGPNSLVVFERNP